MSAVYVNGGFRIFSVTAGSDRLVQNVYSSSGWSGWQDLANDGEALSGSPGVAYDSGDGSMHVFALGKNGAVYQDTLTSSGGSTWGSLGGGLQGGLSAVYEGGGFHVFSVSPSGNLYQDTWGSASGWTGWQDLGDGGNALYAAPGVAYDTTDGSFHVFALSLYTQNMYQTTYTPGTGWGSFQNLGGGLEGGINAAYAAP